MLESPFLHSVLAIVHTLTGAVWLGAMCYSFFLLHPRAHAYFTKDAEFETFIATISQGARYPVLAALAVLGLSGAALVLVRWPEAPSVRWLVLIAAKTALFLTACGLFVHISWRLWPARILALPGEVPRLQGAFRRAAAIMILLAGLSMTLGILAHTW